MQNVAILGTLHSGYITGGIIVDTPGKRLRNLRKERGLSLEEASRRLHLSFSALAMYERDERTPSADRLQQLADFYSATTDYLLGRSSSLVVPELASQHDAYLAASWPNLSPDRRERAYRLVMAFASKGQSASKLPVIPADCTNELFDVMEGAVLGAMAALQRNRGAADHE